MEPKGEPEKTPLPTGERRKEPRFNVESSAVLHLLDLAIHLRGRLLDLSMSGCQFRTEDCYTMGIYRRVEVEFTIEGMPFRLSGVTQSIHKKTSVGIRFLNVSNRKHEQLAEIIAEIQQALEAKKARESTDAEGGPGAL